MARMTTGQVTTAATEPDFVILPNGQSPGIFNTLPTNLGLVRDKRKRWQRHIYLRIKSERLFDGRIDRLIE
jgi:hypothetical protein